MHKYTKRKPHTRTAGEGSEYPCFLLEDGARRPPSYCGYPILILTAKRGLGYLNSRPGSPCPGLQHPNKQPHPLLPAGKGSDTLLVMLFSPLHRSTFGRLPEQEGEGKAALARRGGGAAHLSLLSSLSLTQKRWKGWGGGLS